MLTEVGVDIDVDAKASLLVEERHSSRFHITLLGLRIAVCNAGGDCSNVVRATLGVLDREHNRCLRRGSHSLVVEEPGQLYPKLVGLRGPAV